ncbi:MAG: TetR/AcrR family transcriptional regulator [Flavobacteriaceae bacterium]
MATQTSSRPPVRRMPRDQRVATIMQTAREVLRERGYEQFLTSEVAERCGISEGTIYKYFASKRDLLIKVAEAWFDEFLAQDPPSRQNRPIRDRLFHVIFASLATIRREPALSRFVLTDLRADPNYRKMRVFEQNRQITAYVMDVIEEGVRRGELRGDVSMKLVRDIIFGGIEHQTWAFLRGEGEFSIEDSADGLTDVVLRGIGAEGKPQAASDVDEALARLENVTEALQGELSALRKS